MKLYCLYAIMLLAMTAAMACKNKETTAEKAPEKVSNCISDTLRSMIAIGVATEERIADVLTLAGEVNFNQDRVNRVFAPTSGVVLELKANLGDYVSKGQTLATVKSIEIVSSYNDIAIAQADLASAEKNLRNAEALLKGGLAAERDVTVARADFEKAQSNLNKAQTVVSIYGSDNTKIGGIISIKAPASGFIVEKKIAAGQQIRADNADNLFTISDLQEVWIIANVFENDISRVKVGETVAVTTLAYPDKVFNGKVDNLSAMLDPESKVLKARIRLQNSGGLLKPEMFTNVTVQNREGTQAITIPSTAVLQDYGKSFVIAFQDSCHYEIRNIQVLKVMGEKTYISSGLQAGEKVITKQELLLFNQLKEQ
jgi:membrane fusion protein, heavy metal efflux system